MRTKTLLAAAVLAAGLATSMAQSNVYSLNVVGYVTQVSPAASFTMIANPLNATNNAVPAAIQNPRVGMILYKFNGGYTANSYNGATWTAPAETLNPGEGAFLFVPAGIPHTNTWVGEVLQGSLTNQLVAGFTLVGSKVPQAGLVSTDLAYPGSVGAIIYQFSGAYVAYSHNGANWLPNEPTINVAEGFFSSRPSAANWVRNFTVQ